MKIIKLAPKARHSWTTTNLVSEALDVNLHILEDECMISWLGRGKFVELCNGTNGWQDGVSFLAFLLIVF